MPGDDEWEAERTDKVRGSWFTKFAVECDSGYAPNAGDPLKTAHRCSSERIPATPNTGSIMKSHPRFLLSAGVVAAALICCAPSPLQAVDKFWIASGGGTFGTAANWSLSDGGVVGGGVPVAADVANFTLNNTYTVNFGAGVTNTNLDVDNGDVTFNLNRNTYTLTGSSGIDIGLIAPQTGRLTLRNGALAVDTNGDKVEIGGQLSSGFLTVTTGASLGTAALRPAIAVGRQSMGTLTVSDNGRVDASELIAGILSFGTGTVTIAGPTAVMDVSGTMTLGDGGKVTLDVTSGGTLTSGGTVTLANALGSDSVATISGANSRWNLSSGQTIGSAGRGVMTISGGGQVVSSSARRGLERLAAKAASPSPAPVRSGRWEARSPSATPAGGS